jgi:hypothetical protein
MQLNASITIALGDQTRVDVQLTNGSIRFTEGTGNNRDSVLVASFDDLLEAMLKIKAAKSQVLTTFQGCLDSL